MAALDAAGASAVAAAAVEECMASATTLLSLPTPLILRIFGLLRVDCRLRCAEVCRGWRSVLAERSAWTRLDVSLASGMYPMGRPLSALLRCASARAGGALQSLRVDTHVVDVHEAALLEMLAANAGALRELRVIHSTADTTRGYGFRRSKRCCARRRRCASLRRTGWRAMTRKLRAARCATRRPSRRCA
jgi:hypothetical protein